jgi:hypothetical protein
MIHRPLKPDKPSIAVGSIEKTFEGEKGRDGPDVTHVGYVLASIASKTLATEHAAFINNTEYSGGDNESTRSQHLLRTEIRYAFPFVSRFHVAGSAPFRTLRRPNRYLHSLDVLFCWDTHY